jgi:hypothetical protein
MGTQYQDILTDWLTDCRKVTSTSTSVVVQWWTMNIWYIYVPYSGEGRKWKRKYNADRFKVGVKTKVSFFPCLNGSFFSNVLKPIPHNNNHWAYSDNWINPFHILCSPKHTHSRNSIHSQNYVTQRRRYITIIALRQKYAPLSTCGNNWNLLFTN